MTQQSKIRLATAEDSASTNLPFIQGLAEYEKMADQVVATEQKLKETLFGNNAAAEVVIAEYQGQPAGFALFFHNYSTFLAQPGLYLERSFCATRVSWQRSWQVIAKLFSQFSRRTWLWSL
ncbi:hypothetical protein ALON55S_07461 [Alishewanella longhuensis]